MPTEMSTPPAIDYRARARLSGQNLWSGILFGVGLVAFIDESVFHQILHWHHFYDLGTPELGLVSDGLFHAVSWAATIGGLFMLADLRRRRGFWQVRWWGGVLLGAGVFQLYDGLVQHKLLGIHQIRYVPDVFAYDLVWNAVAVGLALAGTIIAVRTRRRRVPAA